MAIQKKNCESKLWKTKYQKEHKNILKNLFFFLYFKISENIYPLTCDIYNITYFYCPYLKKIKALYKIHLQRNEKGFLKSDLKTKHYSIEVHL